jgi:hypothetical protein
MLKININETLQWIGAACIIAGHSANAIGPQGYPWNIVAFFLGTIAFLIWTLRVANKPQMLVNIVALFLGGLGLFNAFI